MYRPLSSWLLTRLALGPARPCELQAELQVDRPDIMRVLRRLHRQGVLSCTRGIRKSARGGNVASVYELVRE